VIDRRGGSGKKVTEEEFLAMIGNRSIDVEKTVNTSDWGKWEGISIFRQISDYQRVFVSLNETRVAMEVKFEDRRFQGENIKIRILESSANRIINEIIFYPEITPIPETEPETKTKTEIVEISRKKQLVEPKIIVETTPKALKTVITVIVILIAITIIVIVIAKRVRKK